MGNLFIAGQYTTKTYGTITDVIQPITGSASCCQDQMNVSSHKYQFGIFRFWREPQPLFFVDIPSIISRPDEYNTKANKDIQIKNKFSNFFSDHLLPHLELHVQALRCVGTAVLNEWLSPGHICTLCLQTMAVYQVCVRVV